ncbi:hypothetical protein [Actinomadura sp. 6N118]|uniref:hypothetical protein n=1 Tax=Actinomadura sp. 6N118 TaxID=3375151 RepID=UPI0037B98F2E
MTGSTDTDGKTPKGKGAASKGAESKGATLNRGRSSRRPDGPARPSAVPLPDMPEPEAAPVDDGQDDHAPRRRQVSAGRAAPGHGRRGHLRKLSLELTPDDHDRLKFWLLNAFGGDAKATPVLRALLAEAYADPALTERVRRRLQ